MLPKMPRAVFSGLALTLILTSCLEPDFDYFSLHVQARGLAANEQITVSNGSSLEISGNDNLAWTEPQKFKQSYRSDNKNYTVRITRQPSNSNKVCRVLNPKGMTSHANSMIRIECGYPLVLADTQMTMSADNGLVVSNQFEQVALNSSRSLVTSLNHELVQDPTSSDPNDQKLKVMPVRQNGAISFSTLYLENETITLSLNSFNQGCEIAGANSDSRLSYTFPSPDSFNNTVQTISLETDWISSNDKFGNGRTCQDFADNDEYFLEYSPAEKPEGASSYTASCFPAPAIEVSCGLALKLQVRGLETDDVLVVTATSSSGSHQASFDENTNFTFNLAFDAGEGYTINIDTLPSGKTCTFDDTGSGAFATSNITEVLRCSL